MLKIIATVMLCYGSTGQPTKCDTFHYDYVAKAGTPAAEWQIGCYRMAWEKLRTEARVGHWIHLYIGLGSEPRYARVSCKLATAGK